MEVDLAGVVEVENSRKLSNTYLMDKYDGKAVKSLWAGLVLSGCDLTESYVSYGLCRSCGCYQWRGGLSQPTPPHQPWHHYTIIAGCWAGHSGHWHDPDSSH